MADVEDSLDEHARRRRELLKKAGTAAATGPAVALLLQGGIKPTRAAAYGVSHSGGPTTPGLTSMFLTTTPVMVTTNTAVISPTTPVVVTTTTRGPTRTTASH